MEKLPVLCLLALCISASVNAETTRTESKLSDNQLAAEGTLENNIIQEEHVVSLLTEQAINFETQGIGQEVLVSGNFETQGFGQEGQVLGNFETQGFGQEGHVLGNFETQGFGQEGQVLGNFETQGFGQEGQILGNFETQGFGQEGQVLIMRLVPQNLQFNEPQILPNALSEIAHITPSVTSPENEGTSDITGPENEETAHLTGPENEETAHTTGPENEETAHITGTENEETAHTTGTENEQTAHITGPENEETSHRTGQENEETSHITETENESGNKFVVQAEETETEEENHENENSINNDGDDGDISENDKNSSEENGDSSNESHSSENSNESYELVGAGNNYNLPHLTIRRLTPIRLSKRPNSNFYDWESFARSVNSESSEFETSHRHPGRSRYVHPFSTPHFGRESPSTVRFFSRSYPSFDYGDEFSNSQFQSSLGSYNDGFSSDGFYETFNWK